MPRRPLAGPAVTRCGVGAAGPGPCDVRAAKPPARPVPGHRGDLHDRQSRGLPVAQGRGGRRRLADVPGVRRQRRAGALFLRDRGGSGLGAGRGEPGASAMRKIVLLMLADALLNFSNGTLLALDFFGFAAVATATLFLVRRTRRPALVAAVSAGAGARGPIRPGAGRRGRIDEDTLLAFVTGINSVAARVLPAGAVAGVSAAGIPGRPTMAATALRRRRSWIVGAAAGLGLALSGLLASAGRPGVPLGFRLDRLLPVRHRHRGRESVVGRSRSPRRSSAAVPRDPRSAELGQPPDRAAALRHPGTRSKRFRRPPWDVRRRGRLATDRAGCSRSSCCRARWCRTRVAWPCPVNVTQAVIACRRRSRSAWWPVANGRLWRRLEACECGAGGDRVAVVVVKQQGRRPRYRCLIEQYRPQIARPQPRPTALPKMRSQAYKDALDEAARIFSST